MKSSAPRSKASFSFAGSSVARQEYHRQVHAALTQLRQQVDARNSRKPPVEHDDIGLGGGIERAEQRVAIGEAADGKAMPRQFATDNLAVVLVVFNDKDADGTRIALLVDRVGLLENWEGSAHGAGG